MKDKEFKTLHLLLDNNAKILIKEKEKGSNKLNVFYKKGLKNILIGNYNYGDKGKVEWMDYNNDYIVILREIFGYKTNPYKYDEPEFTIIGTEIKALFSIKEEALITGEKEELYNMYEEIFIGHSRKKSLD